MCFKLLKNFYCCRLIEHERKKIVSNYLKISTVVDKAEVTAPPTVSNYLKISTVVDGTFRRLPKRFKLLKNFYCCRYIWVVIDSQVSNYLKISTVVDGVNVWQKKIVSNYLKISTVVDPMGKPTDIKFQIT